MIERTIWPEDAGRVEVAVGGPRKPMDDGKASIGGLVSHPNLTALQELLATERAHMKSQDGSVLLADESGPASLNIVELLIHTVELQQKEIDDLRKELDTAVAAQAGEVAALRQRMDGGSMVGILS